MAKQNNFPKEIIVSLYKTGYPDMYIMNDSDHSNAGMKQARYVLDTEVEVKIERVVTPVKKAKAKKKVTKKGAK